MVQKVDDLSASLAAQVEAERVPETPTVPPRPDDVPEQFWDAEKGEVKLRELLAAVKPPAASEEQAPEGEKPPEGAAPDAEQQAAEDAAKAAKLDITALRAEVDGNGDLSPESYAALEKAGFDKSVVSDFIEGQKARVAIALNEAYAVAGGQDAYNVMAQWAATGVPAEDLEAYNAAMAGSAAQRKQAIVALKAQYEAAKGKTPSLLSGSQGASSEDKPFASRAEVTAAMSDPRYARDPAYRAMVARRLDAMDNF